jgi:hypothetical protein
MSRLLPRFSAVLDGAAPILKRLSKAERKLAEQAAIGAGAARWFADFAPLRFTRYARARLGYALRSGHIKRKKDYGVPEPLVWTGETKVSVLTRARFAIAGSAGKPTAEIKMPLPGPRAPIVGETLSQVLDSELGGFGEEAGRVLGEILGGATGVSKRSKKLTLAGASSSLTGVSARRARALQGDRNDHLQDAQARRSAIADARPAHAAAVSRRLKRTHDRWRRTSGGSAGPVGGAGAPAGTYLRSTRYRHAQAQARYRARY